MLAGALGAARLRRRARLLLELKAMLQRFQTGIRYAAESLPEMILEQENCRFCRMAERDGEFLTDPAGALERAGRALLWDREDLEWYLRVVAGLGVTDTQGQLEHLRLYSALLEPRLSQAREEAAQKAKISVALGLFAGTALALLLL